MKQILDRLEILKKLYLELAEKNMAFYRNNDNTVEFNKLVDDRKDVINQSETIINELRSIFNDRFPECNFKNKNLVNMLMVVANKDPELALAMQEISNVFKELMDTDKLVTKKINLLQEKIKSDITKARTEAKSIQGYRQLDTYGSCFINKIK